MIDVVTEGPFLDAGVRVKVLNADGYRHVVREVFDADDLSDTASRDA